MLYVHWDIKLNYKKIIDMNAMRYPRRLVLKEPINWNVAEEKSLTSLSGSLKFLEF